MNVRRRQARPFWSSALELVPSNGSLAGLVEAVSTARGRPITMLDHELPPHAPSGYWLALPERDYIVCAMALTADHRRVVVCHELAHMLLGHQPEGGSVDTSLVAPTVAPEVAARFLARNGYAAEMEVEAESLATVLATALAERTATTAAASARAHDNVSSRLR